MIDSSFSLQSGRRLSALIVAIRRVAARLLSAIASRGSLPRWGARARRGIDQTRRLEWMQRDHCDGEMQLLHEAIYVPEPAALCHHLTRSSRGLHPRPPPKSHPGPFTTHSFCNTRKWM
ncbi:hypothetical protein HBI46_237390 [Parastagonospora nodorum]|nr:hypothetical protein HBI46_237390 [Parastagonospora nodorum]KAH5710623.1 hypothetical protein HBI20_177260 [Parastagonospora nodorum]KAH6146334.1 hypothetical protein HBI68_201800 [Parastagonospora nodorum]KAH6409235.1 hypothetical protein HBI14_157160 [Parastagonospora nodorum]